MFKHIQIVMGEPPVGRQMGLDWVKNAEKEVRLAFAAQDLLTALIQTVRECEEHGLTPPASARQAIISATGKEP